jgi:hypothetical protein
MKFEEFQEQYRDIPESVKPPVKMLTPNEVIPVYKGTFELKTDKISYEIEGEISFHWLPAMKVRFEGLVVKGEGSEFDFDLPYEVFIDGLKFGSAYITNRQIGSNHLLAGYVNRATKGDRSIGVSEVTFIIPNMKEFFGKPVKTTTVDSIKTSNARITFKSGHYTIDIDKLPTFKTDHITLKSSGGYMALYAGRITDDRGTIKHKDVIDILGQLHHFLYLLGGRRNVPLFLSGIHDEELLWQDCTPFTSDVYKYVQCWSDIMTVDGLQELWDTFDKYWHDENDRDFLQTVIHWYVEANASTAYVEGSIILTQTALELVYNWMLIDKKKLIIGKDAESLSASNKIRLILNQLDISPVIPANLVELLGVPEIADGPEVFVQIRNGLIHGQERKRRELMNISILAKNEALTLGVWYLELALLKILDYKGKYNNRVSEDRWFGVGQVLPWNN